MNKGFCLSVLCFAQLASAQTTVVNQSEAEYVKSTMEMMLHRYNAWTISGSGINFVELCYDAINCETVQPSKNFASIAADMPEGLKETIENFRAIGSVEFIQLANFMTDAWLSGVKDITVKITLNSGSNLEGKYTNGWGGYRIGAGGWVTIYDSNDEKDKPPTHAN